MQDQFSESDQLAHHHVVILFMWFQRLVTDINILEIYVVASATGTCILDITPVKSNMFLKDGDAAASVFIGALEIPKPNMNLLFYLSKILVCQHFLLCEANDISECAPNFLLFF